MPILQYKFSDRSNEWGVLKLGAISWGTFNEQENKALLSGTTPKTDLEVQPGDLLFTRKIHTNWLELLSM